MEKILHIVSFDVPFPPNYGGVIDVFYKIKSLSNLGVKIHLHVFQYGRERSVELEIYCETVQYYPRKNNQLLLFSRDPYIVVSRNNDLLNANLKKDNYPILFEGLHTTYPLLKNDLSNRKTYIRTHNIEHQYYHGLAQSEKNWFKKKYFKSESKKLGRYEYVVEKSSLIFAISPVENEYFKERNHTQYLPVFQPNDQISSLTPKGKLILYHGDLRVADNIKSCLFLIDAFKESKYTLTIASSIENSEIHAAAKTQKNISIVKIDPNSQKEINDLLSRTHVNVLPTFQKTGIKLKLINALFKSRFCLVNTLMVEGTGLEKSCVVADSKSDFLNQLDKLMSTEYGQNQVQIKEKVLSTFTNKINAQKIVSIIFD